MRPTLYAIAVVLTSQGWFQPGHVLPIDDLPEDEVEKLQTDRQAFLADHDGPFAAHARAARAMDPHRAAEFLAPLATKENKSAPLVVPDDQGPTRIGLDLGPPGSTVFVLARIGEEGAVEMLASRTLDDEDLSHLDEIKASLLAEKPPAQPPQTPQEPQATQTTAASPGPDTPQSTPEIAASTSGEAQPATPRQTPQGG